MKTTAEFIETLKAELRLAGIEAESVRVLTTTHFDIPCVAFYADGKCVTLPGDRVMLEGEELFHTLVKRFKALPQ